MTFSSVFFYNFQTNHYFVQRNILEWTPDKPKTFTTNPQKSIFNIKLSRNDYLSYF